jgi:hypothetical protein
MMSARAKNNEFFAPQARIDSPTLPSAASGGKANR